MASTSSDSADNRDFNQKTYVLLEELTALIQDEIIDYDGLVSSLSFTFSFQLNFRAIENGVSAL